MSLPSTWHWPDPLGTPPRTPMQRAPWHADQTGGAQHAMTFCESEATCVRKNPPRWHDHRRRHWSPGERPGPTHPRTTLGGRRSSYERHKAHGTTGKRPAASCRIANQHPAIPAQTLSRLAPGLTGRPNTVAGDACLGGSMAQRGMPPQRLYSSPPPLGGTEFALPAYADTPRRLPLALWSPVHERHAADGPRRTPMDHHAHNENLVGRASV